MRKFKQIIGSHLFVKPERWLKTLDLLSGIFGFSVVICQICSLFKNQIVNDITSTVATIALVSYLLWFTYGIAFYRKSMPKIGCWHKFFYIWIIVAVIASIIINCMVN